MSDRYQYRRYRFQPAGGSGFPGLTPMVQRIMIANGIVFILQLVLDQQYKLAPELGVSTVGMFDWLYLWQPLTYMWAHANFMHILFNMFALYMFGGQLEQVWGSNRFLRFYLMCGIGAGFIILGFNTLMGVGYPTIGASGAVFGLLTAFSLLWPDRQIMLLFPPMPIKAIWFIPLLFVLQLALGGSDISHIGHLGGVIVAGIILRQEARQVLGLGNLRYRWHRFRMRNRLRAVRREEFERRRRRDDDDDDRPTMH